MRRGTRRTVYAGRGGIRREVASILFGGARRRRLAPLWAALGFLAGTAGAAVALAGDDGGPPGAPPPQHSPQPASSPPPPSVTPLEAGDEGSPAESWPAVEYRRSRPIGLPYDGRLVRGVELPAEGEHFFTWDPILRRSPNRRWRRYGTDRLVRVLLRVAREHREDNPDAPRIGIGDLSRPRGGDFGARFGGLGHASHQNGLDADVYFPRRDWAERRAWKPSLVDRRLAQDLVDRFVAAGAVKVFVGPSLGLRGPRGIVVPLVHHDDHLHVRLRTPRH